MNSFNSSLKNAVLRARERRARDGASGTGSAQNAGMDDAGPDPLRAYWHPVSWAGDLGPAPRATTLLDEPLVLWRDATGSPRCFRDICLHRGTALSLGTVDGGCLVCPYHGWAYDDSGACTLMPQLPAGARIPSRARATSYRCTEANGIVWVALEDPVAPVPVFPEWDDPGYRHVPCAPYTWATSAPRMVENFTDFGHLGWLHDGLLGTKDALEVPPHHVEQTGVELHYEITMEVPNTNDRFAVTDVSGNRGLQTNTYVLTLPHTILLRCTYHDTGAHRTLFFAAQPESAKRSTGFCYQSRDFGLDEPDAPYAEFQELLAEQDRVVIESQRPEELPIDLAAELQLPFDRVAIAYRRGLASIGINA
ncbi:MAG: aromatic ring-hydroxylating dioxygenase subunit alpha [Actinomycetia bacterium]|nr:aromatic ring-hydroxylating dioxygenase subunit alpha [Actinomycetes bacterium]